MLPDLSGETVYLLGGGPSLRDALRVLEENPDKDRKVFAINDSIHSAPRATLLFFRDSSWYIKNRDTVEAWLGPVVSSFPSTFYSDRINVIKTKHSRDFLIGTNFIRYGRTSGHLALSLAVALGAIRCVLLGYDCRNVDGKYHYRRDEPGRIDLVFHQIFLPAWKGWGDAARRAGVEVYNATPNSAIPTSEFPYRPLAELL